jgi:hypothetical protein
MNSYHEKYDPSRRTEEQHISFQKNLEHFAHILHPLIIYFRHLFVQILFLVFCNVIFSTVFIPTLN